MKEEEISNGNFIGYFVRSKEHVSFGSDSSIDGDRYFHIYPSNVKVINLNFGVTEKFRQCDPNVRLLSPCFFNRYDQIFGKDNETDAFMKNYNLTHTKIAGIDEIEKITGCQVNILINAICTTILAN